MVHTETTIDTNEIFQGRVLRITRDEVRLEDGTTTTREVVHHPGGACVVAVNEAREVYLVRQFRYAMGKEILELPAGKLEPGDDPFAAAKRELQEECGLKARRYVDLHPFYPSVGYTSEIIYMWLGTDLEEVEMALDEDEFLTPVRIPLAEAVDMVRRGEICDGKTIAGLLKADALI